jgi:hypothetical protein
LYLALANPDGDKLIILPIPCQWRHLDINLDIIGWTLKIPTGYGWVCLSIAPAIERGVLGARSLFIGAMLPDVREK